MTISLQAYRLSIGLFNLTGKSPRRKYSKQKMSNQVPFDFIILGLLMFLVQNPVSVQSTSKMTMTMPCLYITAPTDITNPSVVSLSWSQCIKTNDLCHNLLGNRRRLGYKFAVWNCRKALLRGNTFDSNKLIEVKHFIQKHSPHALGLIESDIRTFEDPKKKYIRNFGSS